MNKIGIAVHGGAGPDSSFIKENLQGYKRGIQDAVDAGYAILEKGGPAIDAVEAAVKSMEDNPLFNAGKGSALNEDREAEMCASIMDGSKHKAGAVAIVKGIRNPVSLAKAVMTETDHVYLGETGAMEFAREINMPLAAPEYFITEHNLKEYEEKKQEVQEDKSQASMHGTVGAVAVDRGGNVAAATSTGGLEFNQKGRIGDTSMVGAGTYANNNTCAASATGDGEVNILNTVAFHLSAIVEYSKMPLQKAATYLVNEKCKDVEGDIGLIAINKNAEVAFAFNSERMHRGWKTSDAAGEPEIY